MYPELLCSMVALMGLIILFAAWMGLMDKVDKFEERLAAMEKRYNDLIQSLVDSGLKVQVVKKTKEEIEEDEELEALAASTQIPFP